MDYNNFPVTKFLYGLDNRDYPSSAKKYINPDYNFSRFLISYEKKDISWKEEDSDETRSPNDVLEKLYGMKNNCRKPVEISKSFFSVMEKSEDAFTPFHNDILEECEGECGVVCAPYLIKGSLLLYVVENGKLSVWVALNHKLGEQKIFAPSTYISVFPIDNRKGAGHQLAIDYISLIDGCLEPPVALYTHAFTILTYLCLRKWAEVEIAEIKTLVKKEVKKQKKITVVTEEGLSYFTFDSKWYTEVCNNNNFNVSGHFRLQPYGDGSRRLIYINEFVKHGYHRKALIDKVKDGELSIE
ncbi:MAG: hypothetical protein IJ534_05460 [Bacteroidaceae bacterium]|nr:hypothetical protein [Bacteroidaceae bacterium]